MTRSDESAAVQDELDGLDLIEFDDIPESPYQFDEGDGEVPGDVLDEAPSEDDYEDEETG